MTSKGFRVSKAVIPAAGLGTRFLPATKAMPKEMLPIVDKPVIQYVVEEAGLRIIKVTRGASNHRPVVAPCLRRLLRLSSARALARVLRLLSLLFPAPHVRVLAWMGRVGA